MPVRQGRPIVELRLSLTKHFLEVPGVVIEGDMFLYHERGKAEERADREAGAGESAEARIAELEATLSRKARRPYHHQ